MDLFSLVEEENPILKIYIDKTLFADEMPRYQIPKERLITVFQPMRVKYKDIFDLLGFYKALRLYLSEHGWSDGDQGNDYWESFFYQKHTASGAREYWIRWRVTKSAEEAPYLQYYVDFDWHCVGIKDTEIIKDGKKIKLNKGEVEVYIKAYIEKKYVSGFDSHWFLSRIKNQFTNRIYADTLDIRKKELYQEAYQIQHFMKQWFKLKRYAPYEEYTSFWPSKAHPSHIKSE